VKEVGKIFLFFFFFFFFFPSNVWVWFLKDLMEKVIVLSASANKLANLKKQAAEYAALIMEELDPDHQGYIEVNIRSNFYPSRRKKY
jgi:hypothetical protein